MFARILTYAISRLGRKRAKTAFHAAWLRAAVQRGDTRRQNETRRALTQAMNARLRCEVQSRGIGWRGLAR